MGLLLLLLLGADFPGYSVVDLGEWARPTASLTTFLCAAFGDFPLYADCPAIHLATGVRMPGRFYSIGFRGIFFIRVNFIEWLRVLERELLTLYALSSRVVDGFGKCIVIGGKCVCELEAAFI